MDVDTPSKPWWRRRRWIAAATGAAAITYPLSFVPACWVLTRIDPRTHPAQWSFLSGAHRPTAEVLKRCPDAVWLRVVVAVNAGRREGGWCLETWRGTDDDRRIDFYRFEHDQTGSWTSGQPVW